MSDSDASEDTGVSKLCGESSESCPASNGIRTRLDCIRKMVGFFGKGEGKEKGLVHTLYLKFK